MGTGKGWTGNFKVVMVGKKKERVTYQTASDRQRLALRLSRRNTGAPNHKSDASYYLESSEMPTHFNHKYVL